MRIYMKNNLVQQFIVEYGFEDVMNSIAQSDYGQQCSLFSENDATIAYAVDNMVNQVCRVNINVACQRGPDYLPYRAQGQRRSYSERT